MAKLAAIFIGLFAASTLWADPNSPSQESTAGEYGPSPVIPAPDKSIVPTLNVAKAKPWQGNAMPRVAKGLNGVPRCARSAASSLALCAAQWRYLSCRERGSP